MRHEYVADIGDFGKYALLSALAGEDLTLGLVPPQVSSSAKIPPYQFPVPISEQLCDGDPVDSMQKDNWHQLGEA